MFHAHQVFGQGLAFRLVLGFGCSCWLSEWDGLGLQRIQLGLQTRFISGQGLFEQLTLLGVHGFGAGGELPGLQAGQLEGDALDLGIFELDGAIALGDELIAFRDGLALRSDVRKHLRGHFGQRRRAQALQVLGFEVWGCESARIQHARIVQSEHWPGYPGRNGLSATCKSRRNCILVYR
jgi:hypothetical protein